MGNDFPRTTAQLDTQAVSLGLPASGPVNLRRPCGHSSWMHRTKLPALCFILIVLFWTGATAAYDLRISRTIGELPLEQVASRTYLIHAPLAAPNRKNEGFIANTGFVVSDDGVVVVDPGGSVQIGRKLLEKIAQVTDKPVVAVMNTHVHGDHWLGNHAIREKYPEAKIYAHEKMIERLRRGEGARWTVILEDLTGGATAGTKAVLPDIGLQGGEVLKFGSTTLRIYYQGRAHTDTDIMIEVAEDKAIFLGDIVMVGRISSQSLDADVKAQISAVEFALATDNDVYIPGHGRAGGKEVPKKALAFLSDLYASVSKYYEEGLSDYEMKDKVREDLSEYADWSGFDSIGRTIAHVYLRVEEDAF